ncbi:hypothetical protein [Streptomyces sp. NPDC101234]|uniref:hypothetical protein n=1 Tax=Streptomyces sp. NPDC101234 TaxID=3366138 RepID=UPI00380D8375
MRSYRESRIEAGTVVYDPRSDKAGEHRGTAGPYALLRPVGGGREWEARPESLRAATAEERLSAEVRAVNRRSSTPGYPALEEPAPEPVPGCAACAEFAAQRAGGRAPRRGATQVRRPMPVYCCAGICGATTGAPDRAGRSGSCRI